MAIVWVIAEAVVSASSRKGNLRLRDESQGRPRLGARAARGCIGLLCLLALLTPVASAQRTVLRPGWNMFTPQQDIDLGKRAEEHTSELQSHVNLVCRLLLEK